MFIYTSLVAFFWLLLHIFVCLRGSSFRKAAGVKQRFQSTTKFCSLSSLCLNFAIFSDLMEACIFSFVDELRGIHSTPFIQPSSNIYINNFQVPLAFILISKLIGTSKSHHCVFTNSKNIVFNHNIFRKNNAC